MSGAFLTQVIRIFGGLAKVDFSWSNKGSAWFLILIYLIPLPANMPGPISRTRVLLRE